MAAEDPVRLGLNLLKAGNLREAVPVLRAALQSHPDQPAVYHYLGNALCDLKEWNQAVAVFTKATELWPQHPLTQYDLALALCDMGEYPAAEAACRRALARQENNEHAHALLGLVMRRQGRSDEAIAEYRRSLELRSDQPGVLNNLGNALLDQGRAPDAAAVFARAIQLQPDLAEAHINLGNALREQGKTDQAEAAYRRALEMRPDSAEARTNLGIIQRLRGDLDEAMRMFEAALSMKPDHPSAHWNKGMVHLLRGEYEQGWPEYEWRTDIRELRLIRPPCTAPQWDGSDLKGRRILIYGEQGLGDTIQFARYLPLVAQRGGKIVLSCRRELVELLRIQSGVAECFEAAEPSLPPVDLQIALPSLPGIFATMLNTIPAEMPYVKAHPDRAARWKSRVTNAAVGKRKVGLVWAGKRDPDPCRATTLAELSAVGNAKGIWFCSLQKGEGAAEKPPAGFQLTDWTDELHDFADTAALIGCLDLVITVDTSVAHLAGAMERPTWLLLQHVPNWRWMIHRTDCPWYPTMRLFRQDRPGDWTAPIAQVVSALAVP